MVCLPPNGEGLQQKRNEEDSTEHLFSPVVAGSVVASALGGALHWLESVFASRGYLIMAVLISGESAGLPLPGETSLLAGAVEAQRGVLSLPWVIAVAAGAAMVGDNVGYWVGNRAGRPALLRYGRFLHIREKQIALLDHYFTRHGAKTVFFGRSGRGSGVEQRPFSPALPACAGAPSCCGTRSAAPWRRGPAASL